MKRIIRTVGNLLWALAGLAIFLILLYFVLRVLRKAPVVGSAAAMVERGLQPPTN